MQSSIWLTTVHNLSSTKHKKINKFLIKNKTSQTYAKKWEISPKPEPKLPKDFLYFKDSNNSKDNNSKVSTSLYARTLFLEKLNSCDKPYLHLKTSNAYSLFTTSPTKYEPYILKVNLETVHKLFWGVSRSHVLRTCKNWFHVKSF